jgi:hypothetical protein
MQRLYPLPSQDNQRDFLYRLYFGTGADVLERIVRRAYQDFSRTMHGIGKCPNAQGIASRQLRHEISLLPGNRAAATQEGFDIWHETTCRALCSSYAQLGYHQFFIGQAQKWVNMTLKYVFVFSETRLPGYSSFYRLCHVPIDNILLRAPEFEALATFTGAWSRINDYEAYLSFQKAVRQRFPASAPLAVEFQAWQRESAA